MQRTTSGSSNNSTPTTTTPSTLSTSQPFTSAKYSSSNLLDDTKSRISGSISAIERPSPFQSQEIPKTPLNTKSHSSSPRSSSILPTPPDSLTRMQQQQAIIDTQSLPPPPGLSFSPRADMSSPTRFSPRKSEISRIQVYEDSPLVCDDSHIHDSFGEHACISPLSGRVRSRNIPLDQDTSIHLGPEVTRDLSETASLFSSVSVDSASGSPSAGSATSRSPSLQASFTNRDTSDQSHENAHQNYDLHQNDPFPQDIGLTDSSPLSNPLMTSNVYINGLPPHFPEQELLELVQKFGSVISAKTFTRNGDPPSGYGFVLFESIQGAEECVKSLRQYRNLHPSFAKRTHRIPGTALEAPVFTPSLPSYPPPAGLASPFFDTHESFNAKMERLADHSSANLYVEGLPANTDAHTLDALFAPHRIRSSRIFPSKLSNPPRMIAFVRLESRDAALETIDKLNGRVIQDWHGADGDKIIVKFADSAHQRDLRKMERLSREQRDQLRLQSQTHGTISELSSPQFSMSLPTSSQVSPVTSFVPGTNAAVNNLLSQYAAASQPQLQTPATPAELERLIEILRLTTPPQPTQLSTQASLNALLAQQQQLQNQTSNLYDLHSRSIASLSPTAPTSGSLYSLPISSRPTPSNHYSGVVNQPIHNYAPMRHDPLPVTSSAQEIDLLRLRSRHSRTDSMSSQHMQSSHTLLPSYRASLLDHGTQRHHPNSRMPHANPSALSASSVAKFPTLQRYVPPPARDASEA